MGADNHLITLGGIDTYHKELYTRLGLNGVLSYHAPAGLGESDNVKNALDELYGYSTQSGINADIAFNDDIDENLFIKNSINDYTMILSVVSMDEIDGMFPNLTRG